MDIYTFILRSIGTIRIDVRTVRKKSSISLWLKCRDTVEGYTRKKKTEQEPQMKKEKVSLENIMIYVCKEKKGQLVMRV